MFFGRQRASRATYTDQSICPFGPPDARNVMEAVAAGKCCGALGHTLTITPGSIHLLAAIRFRRPDDKVNSHVDKPNESKYHDDEELPAAGAHLAFYSLAFGASVNVPVDVDESAPQAYYDEDEDGDYDHGAAESHDEADPAMVAAGNNGTGGGQLARVTLLGYPRAAVGSYLQQREDARAMQQDE